jgi:hypothetical protein
LSSSKEATDQPSGTGSSAPITLKVSRMIGLGFSGVGLTGSDGFGYVLFG